MGKFQKFDFLTEFSKKKLDEFSNDKFSRILQFLEFTKNVLPSTFSASNRFAQSTFFPTYHIRDIIRSVVGVG